MDNFDLFVGISRPVVNHTGCVTSLCTRFLKSNLERAISKCRYLTKDLFETVEPLREAIPPEQDLLRQPCTVTSTSTSTSTSNTTSKRHTFKRFIYTADIKAFYPSTPHKLILEAYESFNPGQRLELRLIKELLSFNFITNGTHVYYMGLTLAPLLARMCTGHLLRGFTTPLPGPHRLTVYYDDIAATFPLDNPAISNICQTLSPYQLTMTSPNTTQDAIYDVMTGNFRPFCQPFRQPTLLHPHSNHPYSRLTEQTFYSSVYRAVQISTQPRESLQRLVSVYMPILLHLGHQKTEVIRTLTEMAYFPTARRTSAINQPQPSLQAQVPTIKYCWSDTRPCMAQLKQFTTTKVFLKPILLLSPMRTLLTYHPPNTSHHGHEVLRCGAASPATCLLCDRYQTIYHANLKIPILPCSRMRQVYLLFHASENDSSPMEIHIGITNASTRGVTLKDSSRWRIVRNYLERLSSLRWQTLEVLSPHYRNPVGGIEEKIVGWRERIQQEMPHCRIYPLSDF